MSIKARLDKLEESIGGDVTVKMLTNNKDGTYTEHVTNRILTKKEDEYIYEDGSLLDTGGEKDTCVIMCLTVRDK